MKNLAILTIALLMPAAVLAGHLSGSALDNTSEDAGINLTRSCQPKIGAAAATLNASLVADADSGALTDGSKYLLRCDTDHYVRFGAAAVTATSADWYVNAGEVWEIPTGGSQAMLHISVLGKTVDGTCTIIQCY